MDGRDQEEGGDGRDGVKCSGGLVGLVGLEVLEVG